MAAPKLRFKEFDGDWERIKLSQMGTFKNGINKDKEDFGHGVPFINLMDVFGKNSICQNTFDLVNANSKEIEAYSLKQGDVLFIRSSVKPEGVAETAVVLEDLDNTVYSGFLIRYRPSKDIDLHYKKYCFSTDFFRKNVLALSTTSANTNINQESLSLLNLDLPSKPEQTKIASFLSAVDEKISQLTRKHELLSQYKQGMMQKLFSQQIRFKADDGSEFGEWEEVKFSGIFNFHQTNSYSRALLAEYGEIMNIHYGDIHTKFSMLFDVNKESVPFLNDEVDTSKIAKEQFLKVGDLVIADASEDYKDIGKSIEVISLNNQKVVAGLHTYIARPVKPFALGFCGYMMQTFPVREQIKKLATGISVLGISKTNLGKVELKVPSLEEQTKIANFLSAIDQKIEVVVQQIEQAKTWKKGLLQQMFV